MTLRHRLEPLLLAMAVAFSRFGFRSHQLYDLDSVNFALAMGHFDPRLNQPHPPGYFLYIVIGRSLNSLVQDANLTLVILSIAASCGAILLIYKLALDWFGLRPARFASLLFLFSPLAWFHGTVALTYSVEAFFSALMGCLCWYMESGRPALIAPAAIVLGISAGIRPSSVLFLAPLYVYSMRKAEMRRKVVGLAVLALTLLAWVLPMLRASGGFAAYFNALFSLWRLVPSNNTVFNSSPATSIARAFTILFIYLLGFGSASLALISSARRGSAADPEKRLYTVVWVTPALCFFTFVFLQFVNSGYLLLLASPACVWLGYWTSEWYRNSTLRKPFKRAVVVACAVINCLIFLVSPLYCSYRSVRRFEAQLNNIQKILPQLGSADDTLVISFDSHFLGYRHAGYYLPGYLTLQYPELNIQNHPQIYSMQNRSTRLLTDLPTSSRSRLVFFPLPGTDVSYAQYLAKVKSLLPDQSFRTVSIDGYDFVTGPASLLPFLFPDAANQVKTGVYPPLHSGTPDVNRREHQIKESHP